MLALEKIPSHAVRTSQVDYLNQLNLFAHFPAMQNSLHIEIKQDFLVFLSMKKKGHSKGKNQTKFSEVSKDFGIFPQGVRKVLVGQLVGVSSCPLRTKHCQNKASLLHFAWSF